MYNINLLGLGQAYYDGKPLTGFPVQQHCLLFYYLLLNRQTPHTREQVAAVFWDEGSSTVARKNLRNSLWRLSQSFRSAGALLEDLIIIQEDCIVFTNTVPYYLDIDEFEEASRCCLDRSQQELIPEQVSLLEKAADLYKGDLLEGVYEDWCTYERERLRLSFLNILNKLMNHHGRKGNYERARDYGQRILQQDATHERVHREMMMIHWLAGDREAALQQYISCCKVLRTELGIEPMQETKDLYDTIVRGSFSPDKIAFDDPQFLNKQTTQLSGIHLQEMLQKLHFLEMIVEQTNTELHLLERMLHSVLDVK